VFKFIYLSIFLFFTHPPIFNNIDSLLYRSILPLSKTEKLNTYDKIIKFYYENDTSKVIAIINKAENLSKTHNDLTQVFKYKIKKAKFYSKISQYNKAIKEYNFIIDSMNISILKEAYVLEKIAFNYNKINNYKLAIYSFKRAILLYKKQNKYTKEAFVAYHLASIHKTIGNYSLATTYALNSLKILEKEKKFYACAKIYNILGSVAKYNKNYKQSLKYYINALNIHKNHKDSLSIASSYNYIGIVYDIIKEYDTALDYYKKSLIIKKKHSKPSTYLQYNNIAMIYAQLNQTIKAHQYLDLSYKTLNKNITKRKNATLLNTLAFIYFKEQKYFLAEKYFKKSLELSIKSKSLNNVKNNYLHLYKITLINKEYQKALNYYKLHKQVCDKLFNIDKSREIHDMTTSYRQKKIYKEQKIIKEREKYFNALYISALIIIVLILLIIIIIINARNKKNKLLTEKINLEKQLMQKNAIRQKKDLTSTTLQLSEKVNFIEEVVNAFQVIQYISPVKQKKAISDLIRNIQNNNNSSLLNELEYRLEQLDSKFFDKIITAFPNLTANERKLISFLKLNLNTKEISHITKQTPHSINVARTRLRKKLNIDNQNISLTDFFDIYTS